MKRCDVVLRTSVVEENTVAQPSNCKLDRFKDLLLMARMDARAGRGELDQFEGLERIAATQAGNYELEGLLLMGRIASARVGSCELGRLGD